MPSGVNRPFGRLSPCGGQVAYALLTRPPLAANVLLHRVAARLACVRPAASVYPEPGSNSSLYKIFIFFRYSKSVRHVISGGFQLLIIVRLRSFLRLVLTVFFNLFKYRRRFLSPYSAVLEPNYNAKIR